MGDSKASMDDTSITDAKGIHEVAHQEEASPELLRSLAGNAKGHTKSADVAMKLFQDHDFNMEIDPDEQKKLVRKIDLIILPMIAVNYAFFYIDKVRP